MTDTEKAKITELRQQGFGYKKISQKTGLSINTVKSFCQRNKLSKAEQPDIPKCKFCGKELPASKGRKERKFCSDACRFSWWNKYRKEHLTSQDMEQTCPICGEAFHDYPNRHRKYCSLKCYQASRFGVNVNG